MKAPLGGGTPTTLATSPFTIGPFRFYGVAVDSASVFWADAVSGGRVMKVAKQ